MVDNSAGLILYEPNMPFIYLSQSTALRRFWVVLLKTASLTLLIDALYARVVLTASEISPFMLQILTANQLLALDADCSGYRDLRDVALLERASFDMVHLISVIFSLLCLPIHLNVAQPSLSHLAPLHGISLTMLLQSTLEYLL